ncbi:MAG: sterol desaturase family protein [Paracoccus sp. (in: a-proteobacteria)]
MFVKTWSGRSYDLGKMTMRDLVPAYLSFYAIQAYLGLALVSIIAAIWLADGWTGPLAAALAIVVLYPVVWYLLHRWVLHSNYLYRYAAFAAMWKRIHFDHHQDPHRLEVLFGALHTTLPTIAVVTIPVGWAIAGPAGAASGLAAGLLTTCVYEFVHCIQHLNFKPKSRILKHMKEHHLLHHFHNEDGNYGITTFTVDKMMGTYYDKAKDRPRSPHVYNLGYDEEMAKRYPWVAEKTGHPPMSRPPTARQDV